MSESGFRYGWSNLNSKPYWKFQEGFGTRGNFKQRIEDALKVKCEYGKISYAHLPLDFLKNKEEGLKNKKRIPWQWDGENDKTVKKLFGNVRNNSKELKENEKYKDFGFVFHHEPGTSGTLEYYDETRRDEQIKLLTNLAAIIRPISIEIHPGRVYKQRTGRTQNDAYKDLSTFINDLRKALDDLGLEKTKITLENRTKFMIQKSEQLIEFYKDYGKRIKNFGFALDISQIYTTTGSSEGVKNFIHDIFNDVGSDKIHEWHIHKAHGAISENDPVRWSDPDLMKYFHETKETAKVLIEVWASWEVQSTIKTFEKIYQEYKQKHKKIC